MTKSRKRWLFFAGVCAVGLVGALVASLLLFLRIPDDRRFDETMIKARYELEEGKSYALRWTLLQASRFAVSSGHWNLILLYSYRNLPDNPKPADYRNFTRLSSRAASALPGREEFKGYKAWALMREESNKKAYRISETLGENQWSSLRAEIRLNYLVESESQSSGTFQKQLRESRNPDFYQRAAAITESGEIAFNAVLLLMSHSRLEEAYTESVQIMGEGRRWFNPANPRRYSVPGVLSRVAYDAGYPGQALRWLEQQVKENEERRTESWADVLFLGELFWKQFLIEGKEASRDSAENLWRRARDIVMNGFDPERIPANSWKIWLNLAVLEESKGGVRKADELRREALNLFLEESHVKAAWLRSNKENAPALVRRLLRSDIGTDPVLEYVKLEVDPESLSPRLYESRLWNLFNALVREDSSMDMATRQRIINFIMKYNILQENWGAMDIAINRYRKIYPADSWILNWRLVADTVRGVPLIDTVPENPGGPSFYDKFRTFAREEQNWRSLYDSALFAISASSQLMVGINQLDGASPDAYSELMDAAVLYILTLRSPLFGNQNTILDDRLSLLLEKRSDTKENLRIFKAPGEKGLKIRGAAKIVFRNQSAVLLDNALKDINMAFKSISVMSVPDRANLYYLKALLLEKEGNGSEALVNARIALDFNPVHIGAQGIIDRNPNP